MDCPACQVVAPAVASFCHVCGTRLGAGAPYNGVAGQAAREDRAAWTVARLRRLAESSLMFGGDLPTFMERVVRLIGELFAVRVVCISEIRGEELFFRMVFIDGQVHADAGKCPANITPCATVEQARELRVYDRVAERFPEETILRDIGADAYCGFPVFNDAGCVAAVVGLLDDKPREFTAEDQYFLGLIGQRIAIELERDQEAAEKARINRSLRESEARYRRAERGTNDGLWEWNLLTEEVYFSPRALAILGYEVGELSSSASAFADLFHPEDLEKVREATNRHFEQGTIYDVEHRLRCKRGEFLWVRSRGEAERDAQGKPVRMAGAITDITERRAAEAAIRFKEELLSQSQKIAGIGSWSMDLATKTIFWTDETYRLYGVSPRAFVPTPESILERLHPDDRPLMRASNRTKLSGAKAQPVEFRVVWPDGSIRWLCGQGEMIRNERGETVRLVGTVQDITARKQADLALRESESRFSQLFYASPFSILLATYPEGRIVDVNGAFLRIFEGQAADVVGKTTGELDIWESLEDRAAMLASLRDTGSARNMECGFRTQSGRSITLLLSVELVELAGQKHSLAMSIDITDRRRAEAAQRELAEIVESTPHFVGSADPGTATVTYINGAGRKLLGWGPDEALAGRKIFDFHPEEANRLLAEVALPTARREGSWTGECNFLHRSGRVVPFWMTLIAQKSSTGEVLKLSTISSDISEVKTLKQAIHENETRSQLLMDSVPAYIAYIDTDERYRWVNRTYEDWYRRPREQIIGATVRELQGEENYLRMRPHLQRVLAGEAVRYENSISLGAGDASIFDTQYLPDRGADGTVRGFFTLVFDVTQERKALSALRESEERYHTLFEACPDAIFILDASGRICEVNPAAVRTHGYTEAELRTMHISELDDPNSARLVPDRLRRMMAGETLSFELEHRRKDGSTLPLEVVATPFHVGEQKLFLAFDRDVSARKEADRKLRLTQFSIDRAVDSVFWITPSAEILYVNDAACRKLGYAREELIGKTVPEIDPNFPREAWPEHWEELRRRGSFSFESDHVRKTGELLRTEVTANHICFEGQEYNCAMLRDITDRKRSEEAVRDREDRFRTFVDHAADAFFFHDDRAVILDCNEQACRSLGYSRSELIGMTPFDFDLMITSESVAATRERLAAGEAVSVETRYRRKDGSTYPVELRLRPFKSAGKLYVFSLAQDLTERKAAEDRVRDLQDTLAHANRYQTIGEIASGLAHELNQPLAAIHLNADGARFLAEKFADPELHECLQQIEEQSFRAGEIIRRMRSFIRRDQARRSACDINRLVDEVLPLARDYLRQRAVEICVRSEEGLPEVEADAIQIQQVLLNLIRNAADAMEPTADRARIIRIYTERANQAIRVRVSDSGPGIDPKMEERLFFPFQTTKPSGMGLGLSICRTIIEAHGGQIGHQSDAQRGTTFFFTLPVSA